MTKKDIRHLPVFDDDGDQIVGVITSGDLRNEFLRVEKNFVARFFRNFSLGK